MREERRPGTTQIAPLHTVRPQVRPAHVGSRDPDDGIRRLHDRWRGALFEADVARTVKNRAPHVSLLCLAIHSANLFAVLLVADLFEPVDILSAQRFLNDTQASAGIVDELHPG